MSSSSQPMSRRRFLAVVGGTGGALGVAGLGGWRLFGGAGGSQAQTLAAAGVDAGVEVVEVEAGFVDATVWDDQLLTLRAAPDGPGIVLHSETTGQDHPVQTPEGFTARCVGVIDDTIVIGGHREIETGQVSFEAGTDYETLLKLAGPEAEALLSQPGRPAAAPHQRTLRGKFASLVITRDIGSWTSHEVLLPDRTGGSVAAVLERSGTLAMDHYRFPSEADSNYEAVLIGAVAALGGTGQFRDWSQSVDHGSIVS